MAPVASFVTMQTIIFPEASDILSSSPIPYLISIPTSPTAYYPVPALTAQSYLAAHAVGFCYLPAAQREPYAAILAGLREGVRPYCPDVDEVTTLRAENAHLRTGLMIIVVAMWVWMVLEAWTMLRPGETGQGPVVLEGWHKRKGLRGWFVRLLWVLLVVVLAPVWCVWHAVWRSVAWRVTERSQYPSPHRSSLGDIGVMGRMLSITALNRDEWVAIKAAAVAVEDRATDDVGSLPEKGMARMQAEERDCLLMDVE